MNKKKIVNGIISSILFLLIWNVVLIALEHVLKLKCYSVYAFVGALLGYLCVLLCSINFIK